MNTYLSEDLKNLVYDSVKVLGDVIEKQYGNITFLKVENLRRSMKAIRGKNNKDSYSALQVEMKKLKKYSSDELFNISHSYAVMLELINRCETAYRSHRLDQHDLKVPKKSPYATIFVFTAHPTEARASNIVELFGLIEKKLKFALNNNFKDISCDLFHILSLILKLPMANDEKPTVKDEAKYIFSFVLKEEILKEQIKLKSQGITLHFRTWVGGDKDGHSGVNEETMQMCFSLSRKSLLEFIIKKLNYVKSTLELIDNKKILSEVKRALESSNSLFEIGNGDGKKVVNFCNKLTQLSFHYEKEIGSFSPELDEINHLVWLYPALVLQIEVREDSEFVHSALKDSKMAIAKMLKFLKTISRGHNPKWYVRGFVLSMVEEENDLSAGVELMQKILGEHQIPVVPLFENEIALKNATSILKGFFIKHPEVMKKHKKDWNGRFEVMLGYSDSSKENGVLPSRHLIAKALGRLDDFLMKNNLTPVFFHGSGGSIERGGGTIKEQTQWWPKSAVNIFKATSQGEMVARTFGDPLVMRGHVLKIAGELSSSRSRLKDSVGRKSLEHFTNLIMEKYKKTWDSSEFFEMVEKATPYSYLDQLKIGSRPTKRTTGGTKRKLRAIPWVLCWTQSRTLFPTWWGVGHAWKMLSVEDRYLMMKSYRQSDLLKSFVKVLGFTLAKVELSVFKMYLSESDLSAKLKNKYYQEFEEELENTLVFFKEISGYDELLWFRPWLQESITFRASMIHPLNLIQILALKRKDPRLLRETVTGISCGMLTTG